MKTCLLSYRNILHFWPRGKIRKERPPQNNKYHSESCFFIIHLGRSTALTGKKNPGRTARKKNKRDAPTTFFLYHPFREIRFSCWEILAATEKLFFLSKVTIGTRYAGLPSIEKEKEPTGQSVDLHGT